MKKFIIEKSDALSGKISVQGSKNSVLPLLAATVLIKGKSRLHNCPELSDVRAAVKILESLGCSVERAGDTLTVDASEITGNEIPQELMSEMRSSVMFLGAILGRTGSAVLSAPGGCDIGKRPIDIHISAVSDLSAHTRRECGKLFFAAENGLKGNTVTLAFPSVGATENMILAACTAKGKTVIYNAACEPEIADLVSFLNLAGASVRMYGNGLIEIEGVRQLHGAEYTVMADRIAAGSYLLAAAATGGSLTVNNIFPQHIASLIPVLGKMGCKTEIGDNFVSVSAPKRLKAVSRTGTMPYPGFPTDLQAPLCASLCRAEGDSVVTENIFEARFKHVPELKKLGADITVQGKTAFIKGVPCLCASRLNALDLRGGFALIIAALQAQGTSEIINTEHIDRGYECPEKVLTELGAKIKRVEDYG